MMQQDLHIADRQDALPCSQHVQRREHSRRIARRESACDLRTRQLPGVCFELFGDRRPYEQIAPCRGREQPLQTIGSVTRLDAELLGNRGDAHARLSANRRQKICNAVLDVTRGTVLQRTQMTQLILTRRFERQRLLQLVLKPGTARGRSCRHDFADEKGRQRRQNRGHLHDCECQRERDTARRNTRADEESVGRPNGDCVHRDHHQRLDPDDRALHDGFFARRRTRASSSIGLNGLTT